MTLHSLVLMQLSVPGHQYQWLAGDYDLDIGHFYVASMVVTWWIVVFCAVITGGGL